MPPQSGTRQIAILLFDGVEELDAVGPWEVLAHWTQEFPADGWAASMISRDGTPVRAAKGLSIHPHHSFADAPALDVIVQPGGEGTRRLMTDDGYMDWLRDRRADVPLLTSVCTGALVYAAAGFLRDRPAATYWRAWDELLEIDPSIQPRREARFVDDGDVITAAGVSAGIDMALHLVARLAGIERARAVRRGIQYDPEPPV